MEDFTPKQPRTITPVNIRFTNNGYVSAKRIGGQTKDKNQFEYDALIISALKKKKKDDDKPESFDMKFPLKVINQNSILISK